MLRDTTTVPSLLTTRLSGALSAGTTGAGSGAGVAVCGVGWAGVVVGWRATAGAGSGFTFSTVGAGWGGAAFGVVVAARSVVAGGGAPVFSRNPAATNA